jgi:hypothetical protein
LRRRGSTRSAKSSRDLKGPVGTPLLDQLLHRLLADALQRAERIADGMALLLRFDGEFGLAGVDGRRQAGDVEPAHVLHEDGQLVGLRHVEAHRGGVEFDWIMGLQPGCLVATTA